MYCDGNRLLGNPKGVFMYMNNWSKPWLVRDKNVMQTARPRTQRKVNKGSVMISGSQWAPMEDTGK